MLCLLRAQSALIATYAVCSDEQGKSMHHAGQALIKLSELGFQTHSMMKSPDKCDQCIVVCTAMCSPLDEVTRQDL